ncbi:MAG: DNA polymerase III subunit gamma/tau [Anaerolineaceae bacterium]|nr:DNA polymerase III subunit gamma/tau [Anaerolineaceae bacterium]
MSQALYRKWRPGTWDEVIGQEHIIQTIKNAIHSDKVGHAYLFAGPRGTGKTTTARLLAKAVNCLNEDPTQRPCNQCANCQAIQDARFLDLIEIDAASNTSVEDIRDLRDKINFSPGQGRFKVYIIDEVHMLSTAAFNALLKTLEEPPAHAIFVLATTEIHKIPATVLSRCQRHEFRRIPVKEITAYLKEMCAQEHFTISDDALISIARHSTGCMRDAISLLDQLTSSGVDIDIANVHAVLGTATNQVVLDLLSSIRNDEMGKGLTSLHQSMDAGSDPRQLARQIVDYLRNLLLIKMGNVNQVDDTPEMIKQMQNDSKAFDMADLIRFVKLFNEAASGQTSSNQPGLALELAYAQAALKNQPAPVAAAKEPVKTEALPPTRKATTKDTTQKKIAPVVDTQKKEAHPVNVEPTQEAPTAPVQAGKSADGLTLNTLLEQWRQIRAIVKKHRPATEALLNSCKPLSIKKGVLSLGFASEVLRGRMDQLENTDLARQAIAHLFDADVQIRCVVIKESQNTDNTVTAPDESMLKTVLDLGGKLVPPDANPEK